MAQLTHHSHHRRHSSSKPATSRNVVVPPKNEKVLDRNELLAALNHLASLIISAFNGHKVTLYAHGGSVMVLHSKLGARGTTRDVDICLREFDSEWAEKGIPDAKKRLQWCIYETARHRGLGGDWMNSAPDVAFPWAVDRSGLPYDPVLRQSRCPGNHEENTIYSSSHLDVVAVSWPWALALKFVRYDKNDPWDIACILHYAAAANSCVWSCFKLESWLRDNCWAMRYDAYTPERIAKLRGNMRKAISLARERSDPHFSPSSLSSAPTVSTPPIYRPSPHTHIPQQPPAHQQFVHQTAFVPRPPAIHTRHSSRSNPMSVF